METFAWDCFLCSLPFLFLLLLSLGLHCSTAPYWTKLPVTSEERPKIVCKPTTLAKYLIRHCGSLARFRRATWPLGDPHLQTLSSLLCGRLEETVQFTRETLLLRDGGIVALDWAAWTGQGERVARRRWDVRKGLGCFTSTPPVLLLIPQLWVGMTPHSKSLAHQAVRQGFHVVVFHARGTSGCPLTTTQLMEFGDPTDLEQVVNYVHSCHPSSALLAVSEGSASGILLSYLGESGSGSALTAAAAISPVFLGQLWFDTVMPPLYHWAALFLRKLQLCRYANSFRAVLDVDRVLGSSSLRDFEETLFCSSDPGQQKASKPSADCGPNHGARRAWGVSPSVAWTLGERVYPAKDWDAYWERNEPLRDADEVAVPVLCIRSCDDPLLPPASTLPTSLFQSNPYFFLALTEKGGHCGFTAGEEEGTEGGRTDEEEVGKGYWSHTAVLEYFRVVADFLKGDQRDHVGWVGPAHLSGQRNRSSATAPLRRRRTSVVRRPRPQETDRSTVDAEDGNFVWRRSYTR